MSARHPARYAVTSGLAGCYLPDNHSGPMLFATRRELADAIRYELEWQEFPKSAIRQVSLCRVWSHIARHGSSTAHFSFTHKGREIAFHGLTESEFEQMEAEADL